MTSNKPRIYLDYAATTPVDPEVVDAMLPWLYERFGNPASGSHDYGWDAQDAVEQARRQVAALVGAEPREIVWTSGATESINLALKGAAQFYQSRGKHIITLKTEHKAVLDTCQALEEQGFEVTYLDVQPDGLVNVEQFKTALRPDTILASVLLVNNEIGVIQDVQALGAVCREHGVVFHVDAAQAPGKVIIDLASWPVDLMSLSAHKVYGPKGVGALFVRRKPAIRLKAQTHGGGHERGFRSGTLATHQIVGMGAAYAKAQRLMEAETLRVAQLQQRLLDGLKDLSGLHVNGSLRARVPHNISLSFENIEGEALMISLSELAVSSGSACTSASLEPSHVLRALGLDDQLAHCTLRLSLGRFTTFEEIDRTIVAIKEKVAHLRAISPLLDANTLPV